VVGSRRPSRAEPGWVLTYRVLKLLVHQLPKSQRISKIFGPEVSVNDVMGASPYRSKMLSDGRHSVPRSMCLFMLASFRVSLKLVLPRATGKKVDDADF